MKVHIRFARLVLMMLPLLDLCPRASAAPASPVFRFSVSLEPTGADPTRISSSETNYFLVNIQRGLYFVDAAGDAKPEIAKSCVWLKAQTHMRCELKKNVKWSDGKPIRAAEFVESWSRLLSPKAKGLGAAILSGIKNADAIHKGTLGIETLGVKAVSASVLEITLEENDPEFLQRLSHPALVVTRTGVSYDRADITSAPVSGPYRVTEWKTANRIRLESNPFYDTIQKTKFPRPPVEILTLDDDETALNLYREGTLTFLRRLPTQYLKAWHDSKELHQIPVARFDYLGFGPGLREEPAFRHALASALNYEELRVIYSAPGVPGCPSIDPSWMSKVPCHTFDLEKAKQSWAKVSAELKQRRWTLHFSKLGGDDIQKGMEWAQSQWKKNLGFNVELKAVEQGVYVSGLRTSPPDLFRKGVGLERATCLAAVEIFSRGNPENFIRLDSKTYETGIQKLHYAKTASIRRQACTEVVQQLIDGAEIIPLGRIHFSLLAKPNFAGWVLNPLNHLDLSHLRATPTP